METSGQGRGLTVWDFIPATLTVVLGVLTNWLSDIWQPAVPVIVGGTLLSIVALDVRLNRASGSPGRLLNRRLRANSFGDIQFNALCGLVSL